MINKRYGYSRSEKLPSSHQYFFVLSIITSSLLVHSWLVPKFHAYLLFVTSLLIFLGAAHVYGGIEIISIKHILAPVIVIFLIYLINLMLNPTIGSILRNFAFPLSFIVGVLIIPHNISIIKLNHVVSRLSLMFYAVGIFGLVIGHDSFLWRTTVQVLPFYIFEIQVPKSVFVNPQTLGFLCLCGVISSVFLYTINQDRIDIFGALVLSSGVWITGHRAALLALGVTVVFVIIFRTWGKIGTIAFLAFGGIGFIIGLLMVLGSIPTVIDVNLGGRKLLWSMGYQKFTNKPLLGYGAIKTSALIGKPVHSSMFRMLITGGLIGFIAYFSIFAYVFTHIPPQLNDSQLLIFTGLLAFLIIDLFAGNTIFGFSFPSTLMSLFLGYSSNLLLNGADQQIFNEFS